MNKTTNAMEYEQTPISKQITGKAYNKLLMRHMNRLSTPQILWYLIKRHKLALLVLSNIAFIAYVTGLYRLILIIT